MIHKHKCGVNEKDIPGCGFVWAHEDVSILEMFAMSEKEAKSRHKCPSCGLSTHWIYRGAEATSSLPARPRKDLGTSSDLHQVVEELLQLPGG